MKILLIHNHYQHAGGEDEVFHRERDLLRMKGHTVIEYVRHNSEILGYGFWGRLQLPVTTVWARDSAHQIAQLVRSERPDVAHFHNTFPLVSPSTYYACDKAGLPVVQTLHNPRLLCPAATFFRNGHVCQDCQRRSIAWPAVVHGCYRNSSLQSAAVAMMLAVHRLIKTWRRRVSLFIVSTEFYRQKFIEGGLPSERIVVKPHFVFRDPGRQRAAGKYALFIGRLAPEKGVPTLLEAWRGMNGCPLWIRGDGPLLPEVQAAAEVPGKQIRLLPSVERVELMRLMKGARFLVWPSQGLYETFGLVAIEAFACGVPVLASGHGVMKEIVEDGRTGLHFTPADPDDLAAKVRWAWGHPEEMAAMGHRARREFEAKYSAARNYQALLEIYDRAIQARRGAADNVTERALA